MKVGTLAFHYAFNYGAVLQSVGLLRTLGGMGIDAEVIDYRSPVHYVPRLVTRHPLRWRNTRLVSRKFDQFRAQAMVRSPVCENLRELEQLAGRYDAIVVGSDQVWNLHKPFEPAFFLDFAVPTGCRRVSYAACFGRDDQPAEPRARVLPALKKFDAISVRNVTSQRVLSRDFGIEAPVTADPTLLADFDDLLAPPSEQGEYTLLFGVDVRNRELLERAVAAHRSVVDRPIVMMRMTWSVARVDRRTFGAGPREWLTLIKQCKLLITDSFHGMVFALKYRRPFAVVFGQETGGRMKDLLSMCGLADRMSAAPTTQWLAAMMESPDWDAVHTSLQPLLDRSRQYLRDALGR